MRWIAIWVADQPIEKDEMADEGREAIEQAMAIGLMETVVLIRGEYVTLTRHQFTLPIFIESPDHSEGIQFRDAIQQRVFEERPN